MASDFDKNNYKNNNYKNNIYRCVTLEGHRILSNFHNFSDILAMKQHKKKHIHIQFHRIRLDSQERIFFRFVQFCLGFALLSFFSPL